jgi:hypothetical protein
MKDPHVHVEKTQVPGVPGIGCAAIRDLIADALGAATDLPATVPTGCGRLRPVAMTTTVPEKVTCLACREHARAERISAAERYESLASSPELAAQAGVAPEGLAAQAREHRELAARFAFT